MKAYVNTGKAVSTKKGIKEEGAEVSELISDDNVKRLIEKGILTKNKPFIEGEAKAEAPEGNAKIANGAKKANSEGGK